MQEQLKDLENAAIAYAVANGHTKDKGFNFNVHKISNGFVIEINQDLADTVPSLVNTDYDPENDTVVHTTMIDDE